MQGVIKNLNDKGFGFISVEGQKDLFFHAKDLVGVQFDELEKGQAVEFETVDSNRGPKAAEIKLVASEE